MTEIKQNAISVRNIKKSFDGGQTYVLNDLSLDIPLGKLTFIIGYSGTGKSVLLRHLLGLIRPSSGTIKVLGKNVWKMNTNELRNFRREIGVLFQYAALFDDMTVLENVCFPIKEHLRDKPREEVREMAKEKLRVSGMDAAHYNKLPNELSGGMRKRVGLARALALSPKILFYDEPTTGLDPIFTEMVNNLISEVHKKQKTTSLIISHDLIASFNMADYIIMLDKGQVILSGTQKDFLESDLDVVKEFVQKGLRGGLENSRV